MIEKVLKVFATPIRSRGAVPLCVAALLLTGWSAPAAAQLGNLLEFFSPGIETSGIVDLENNQQEFTFIEHGGVITRYKNSTSQHYDFVLPTAQYLIHVPDGSLYISLPGTHQVVHVTDIYDSPPTYTFFSVANLSTSSFGTLRLDGQGNLYVATGTPGGIPSFAQITPSGTVNPASPARAADVATPANPVVTCSTAPISGTPFQIPTPMGAAHPPYPRNLTLGPDGNIWFTQSPPFDSNGNPLTGTERIGCMTPSGNVSQYTVPTLNAGTGSGSTTVGTYIAAGGDGNVWFVETMGNLAKITPAGVITEYPLGIGNTILGLALGADGNIWVRSFTGKILRVTPSGTVTNFPTPTANTGSDVELVLGPDRALWYPEDEKIGRITTSGAIVEFPLPTPTVGGSPNFSFQLGFAPNGAGAFLEYSSSDLVMFSIAMADTHDLNGDGNGDILWRNTGGNVAVWLMNGSQITQSAALGAVPSSFSIIGQHDFNGDGKADVLWRDGSGNVSMWFMNGTAVASAAAVGNLTSNWTLYGSGDLNGDGKGDLLWRDSSTGTVAVWFMNGATVASTAVFGAISNTWTILGDGYGGILWRDTAGDIALWGVQSGQVTSSTGLGTVTSNFVVQGVGDFNGDGNMDVLWRDTNSGAVSIWFTNGAQVTSGASVGTLPSNWSVAQVGDYNGDGKSDILLLDSSGDLAVWLMNGSTVSSSLGISNVGTTWQVQNLNDN